MLGMKEVFEGYKKLCRKETEFTVGRWRQEVGVQGRLQLHREVEVKLESMRPHLRKQKFEIGTLSVPSVKALPPFTEEDTDLVSNCVLSYF